MDVDKNGWPYVLRENIIYGMLFKAVALDLKKIASCPLKLSYNPILEVMERVSVIAERKHHEYRMAFKRLGGKIHIQKAQDDFIYYVLVSVNGLQHEQLYRIELLRAECQDRLNFLISQGMRYVQK